MDPVMWSQQWSLQRRPANCFFLGPLLLIVPLPLDKVDHWWVFLIARRQKAHLNAPYSSGLTCRGMCQIIISFTAFKSSLNSGKRVLPPDSAVVTFWQVKSFYSMFGHTCVGQFMSNLSPAVFSVHLRPLKEAQIKRSRHQPLISGDNRVSLVFKLLA